MVTDFCLQLIMVLSYILFKRAFLLTACCLLSSTYHGPFLHPFQKGLSSYGLLQWHYGTGPILPFVARHNQSQRCPSQGVPPSQGGGTVVSTCLLRLPDQGADTRNDAGSGPSTSQVGCCDALPAMNTTVNRSTFSCHRVLETTTLRTNSPVDLTAEPWFAGKTIGVLFCLLLASAMSTFALY